MKRNSKSSNLVPFLASVLMMFISLGACLKSNDVDLVPQDKEEISVTFSVKLPMVSRGLKTYALDDGEETELKDVDVLVYIADGGDWKFHYRTVGEIGPVTPTGDGGGTAQIEVKIRPTQVDSRLVIIANARQQLNAYPFVAGESLTVLQENLVYELGEGERWLANLDGATDDYAPLPMWAEHPVAGGINGGTKILPGDINLLRSLARVDVLADAVAADFTLDRVYVYNSNRNGLIIPGVDSTGPSLPSVLLTNDNDVLDYEVITGNKLEGEIYLFEADAGTGDGTFPPDPDATALVIEGRFYGNATPYFYRIDFKDVGNTALIPLLRNYRYRVNITTANYDEGGELTKEDAFGAASLERISFGSYDRFTKRPSSTMKHTGVVQKSTADITYTVTTINESQ